MRASSNAVWLVLGLVVVGLIVARMSRSLGPVSIIVMVLVVILLAALARSVFLASPQRSGLGPRRGPPKNVTPDEPALPPGAGAVPTSGSRARPGADVIVIDPADGSDRLAAKLEALDRLRADGLVTDQEYEAKRAHLIADF